VNTGLAGQDLIGSAAGLLGVNAQMDRQVGLRVQVNHQNAKTVRRHGGCDIDDSRCFPDAAFLIENCYFPHSVFPDNKVCNL
jgi:hypothetical protein